MYKQGFPVFKSRQVYGVPFDFLSVHAYSAGLKVLGQGITPTLDNILRKIKKSGKILKDYGCGAELGMPDKMNLAEIAEIQSAGELSPLYPPETVDGENYSESIIMTQNSILFIELTPVKLNQKE